jgi:hypothetical protein
MMKKLVILSLFVFGACSKKENDAGGGGNKAKPTEAAPAKLTWKKLGGLPLEAEVPEDANVDDNTQGAGFPSATIWASPTTFVSGAGDMSDLKPTLEETKARLAKDPNKLKKVTKEEKTDDGWVIEVERESLSGGTLYGISVRRTIDGQPWDCGTNTRSTDEVARIRKLCGSLRAAK